MSPQPPSSELSPPDTDSAHYRKLLRKLADMGAEFAEIVLQQARTEAAVATPASIPVLAKSFDLVTRSARRSVLLAEKLAEQPVVAALPSDAEQARRAAQTRAIYRGRITRAVEEAIGRVAGNVEQRDNLRAELHERLDRPDFNDVIDRREPGEVITGLCRDLGFSYGLSLPPPRSAGAAKAAPGRIIARPPPPAPDPLPEPAPDIPAALAEVRFGAPYRATPPGEPPADPRTRIMDDWSG